MCSRSMSGPPPESALVVNQPPKPGMPVRRIHLAWAELIRPTTPWLMYSIMAYDSGRARLLKLNISVFFAALAAACMATASLAFIAGGFSQNTCLPAFRACRASGAWYLFGTMTETASSPGIFSISSTLPKLFGMPSRAASSRSHGEAFISSKPPAPMMPTLMLMCLEVTGFSCRRPRRRRRRWAGSRSCAQTRRPRWRRARGPCGCPPTRRRAGRGSRRR